MDSMTAYEKCLGHVQDVIWTYPDQLDNGSCVALLSAALRHRSVEHDAGADLLACGLRARG